MSKSKGNVIDPLHIIDGVELQVLIDELYSGNIKDSEISTYEAKKREDFPNGIPPCGTDALRFGLLSYLSQHRNINLDVARIVGYRQFCNKIWNAVRFAISKFDQHFVAPNAAEFVQSKDFKDHATFADRWILSRLNNAITSCHTHNPIYEFYQSTDAVFQFFTRELCDVYLELIKGIFRDTNATKQQHITSNILYLCVDLSLKLMHPFMPFVTEELWQRLPGSRSTRDSLIVQSYPTPFSDWTNAAVEKEMNLVLNVIKNLRSHKQTHLNLPTKTIYDISICTTIPFILETVERHKPAIQTLAMTGNISVANTDVHNDSIYNTWSLAEHQIIIDEQTLKYVSYHNVSGLEKKKEN
ncbi:hypothetical protein RFI_08335 [Reticulomyxa filosa]|uniref:valine--tRNA ligase n=1 Tax=Reticulomyxa filosa TaxID=46433 RepID=X6NS06_RETFI|nr:hypothetical protein RFI_08335 [Reticulomyxa filosa]|eukprot:ETO28791.1 hypothetical protein RFI_08335 [Reticulomyxa filosa]